MKKVMFIAALTFFVAACSNSETTVKTDSTSMDSVKADSVETNSMAKDSAATDSTKN